MNHDRRQHPRLQVKVAVAFDSLPALKNAYTRDISKGGIFIICNEQLERDQIVDFELVIAKREDPFKLKGKIVHVLTMPDGRYGLGIEFQDLTQDIKNKIVGLTSGLAATEGSLEGPKVNVTFRENQQRNVATKPTPPERKTTTPTPAKSHERSFESQLAVVEKNIRLNRIFEIFDVKADCTSKELRNAYHNFCKRFHPDLHKSTVESQILSRLERAFNNVTVMYKTLRNPRRRQAFLNRQDLEKSPVTRQHIKHKADFEAQNRGKVEQAERLYLQAQESIAAGELKSALANLKLAVSLHPLESKYKKLLTETQVQFENS